MVSQRFRHERGTELNLSELTIWTFVGKAMSFLFNTLSRFVIAFLPRSNHLLISWLQSPSTVILEPKMRKSVTASTSSPSIFHEVSANLENPAVAIDWRAILIPIPKKGTTKECSNHCTISLISHFGKVMLKVLRARIQQYMNQELPDIQAGLIKGRGTRGQIANIHWIILKSKGIPGKHVILLL